MSGLMSRWMMPARCRVADRARQLGRDPDAFGERELRRAIQPLLQRFAFIKRHHRIEPGLPFGRQFDDLADPQASHARRDPGLADEGKAIGALAGHARMRKLQHELAALPLVDRLEQPAVASVRQHFVEREIVDDVAGFGQVQNGKRRDRVGEFVAVGGRQVDDVEHQRSHVVAAAGIQRRVDQRARGFFRRGALAQQHLQPVIGQHAMNAVAADQQPVVLAQPDGGVVEAGEILEADGAVEQMGEIAASGDVVLGQPLQAPLAQAIGAGVADVNDVALPPRQDDRREGAAHAAELGIDAALRVDPAIGGLQRTRGAAAHAERFREGIIGVDEASNREFGGFASALVSADAVGDRGDDVAVAPAGPAEAGPRRNPHWRTACRSR